MDRFFTALSLFAMSNHVNLLRPLWPAARFEGRTTASGSSHAGGRASARVGESGLPCGRTAGGSRLHRGLAARSWEIPSPVAEVLGGCGREAPDEVRSALNLRGCSREIHIKPSSNPPCGRWTSCRVAELL